MSQTSNENYPRTNNDPHEMIRSANEKAHSMLLLIKIKKLDRFNTITTFVVSPL